jgi:1,4-alpha-glucan branching enzyme
LKSDHSTAEGQTTAIVHTLHQAKQIESLLADDAAVTALAQARLNDPFSLLGCHRTGEATLIRSFQPGALAVDVLAGEPGCNDENQPVLATLAKISEHGLFAGVLGNLPASGRYLLRILWPNEHGPIQYTEDPYAFPALLSELDLHLLAEGRHFCMSSCLGAQPMVIDGVSGTRFAVWAPNAQRVSVVGDFNAWDPRRHAMRLRHDAGVWELFIPRVGAGARYQYDLIGASGEPLPRKADPMARRTETPPSTVSIAAEAAAFTWRDHEWMTKRSTRDHLRSPMSIYEVHASSWRKLVEAGRMDWQLLADALIPYVAGMGFTHIELLPVTEHPFGGSWGYQPLGLFAPTARLGEPAAFASFVDRCHLAGIGVIIDWVPAHFPADVHGMARFDGTALYEHHDPREGYHPDWNTLIYNVGRNEVRGFLINSALEWLERYHVDGLRVDAVSSMLYRDYSRKPGEWIPNIHGGRENLEAIAFLRQLNQVVAERFPGALVIAEESTAWPKVSAPTEQGGLGFQYKWNMGWMHDTLAYMGRDPVYRQHHHHDITFGLTYAFSENAILPISHDEVVHGKGSLLNKMPGDTVQKLANLRAFLGLMWTHPGKKLLFMGCELAQYREWNHDGFLQWDLLEHEGHRGVQNLVQDLNRLYVREPALHAGDCDGRGFSWVIADDHLQSVYAFLRHDVSGRTPPALVVCNFTPLTRHGYRIGVPASAPAGPTWKEVLNTDSLLYGGCNQGDFGMVQSEDIASHGQPASLILTLPALSTLILQPEN